MQVIKRDGSKQELNINKIKKAIEKAFSSVGKEMSEIDWNNIHRELRFRRNIEIEEIQDQIESALSKLGYFDVAKSYIVYREEHNRIRKFVKEKMSFISKYKQSDNTANATVDDNSNVSSKNIGVLNAEIHKPDNIQTSRSMVTEKLKQLFPDFDHKSYIRDLNDHIIYKNDESSFAGAIAPYCVSVSMYPFLLNGIKDLGGLSARPTNLDSFCGMYINMVFAIAGQYAGAVATPEFLVCFDHFARREWGDDYYQRFDECAKFTFRNGTKECVSIQKQIQQYFQQVVYSIGQPSGARGMQSAFVNFSYFDKPFFDGMFEDFAFPDGTKPTWESVKWLQKEFMMWFNNERLRTMLTFPVESVTLLYNKETETFADQDMYQFVCDEYARGHSFFLYISDSVDSLSSCCRLKNMLQTKEFNFTNGNIGVMTGSKSVISLNLSRIVQNYHREKVIEKIETLKQWSIQEWHSGNYPGLKKYLINILDRVYKYHTAYNELLWDMHNANLLSVYKAGFIDLDKQYLTIGLNGLNQAAEYFGINCNDNEAYKTFCQFIFSTIKEENIKHKTSKTLYNTEQVPAESLAVKNYNWDKADGYWVPEDTNLYASYIFKPYDKSLNIFDKIKLHGSEYIGDYLDGGSACHLNLEEHLTAGQYANVIAYAAKVGCQYLTFNIPNSECQDCGHIVRQPITKCPKCGSENIHLYDRIIGYLTRIVNWSSGRQIEQKTRVYEKVE